MKNIMLDLETMGTSIGSAILAIGAVEFDKEGVHKEFYSNIDINSSLDKGFTVDADSIKFWMKQNDQARSDLFKDAKPIVEVLQNFSAWISDISKLNNIQVWGNGSDFDNVMLISAYKKLKAKNLPWKYYENRCYRTITYSFERESQIKLEGTAHNALDDARFQAKYLIELNRKLNLKNLI